MQVPRRLRLRPQYAVQPLGGERGDHAVVEHTGGVHHRGQRVALRNRGKQSGSASRSVTSQATSRPDPARSARRPARPHPAPARRACWAVADAGPRVANRCRATCPPSAPVAPVISTVPGGAEFRRGRERAIHRGELGDRATPAPAGSAAAHRWPRPRRAPGPMRRCRRCPPEPPARGARPVRT